MTYTDENLNFLKSFVIKVKLRFSVQNFIEIDYIPQSYYDFHIGDCLPCWIRDDVITLYPVTDFNGLNFELKFQIDWFCSFWDTWDIVF